MSTVEVGPTPATQVLGRYELRERLAIGGMGTIHRAYDRIAEREVAFKRLRVQSEAARARMTTLFQNEYETLLRLPHPNIVEVYDFGEDREGPYYVMELLSGEDLMRATPLAFRDVCRVLRDVASALAYVHARGLLHRDVSPNNIRLTGDGRSKLIDFGALMPFGVPKEIVGTPACIAPECLTRTRLDARSDLYSLGAVAYWALTRRPAVRAKDIDELESAWDEPPLPPSAYVSGIPQQLDELVLAMLERDPLRRPSSAAHVIDQLTSIADLGPEADEKRVALSYVARPPLCGRRSLIEESAEMLEGMRDGAGGAVLVEGSSGSGRSALLDAIATRAQLSGAVVLRAAGEAEPRSFALASKLVDAAAALYPEIDRTQLTLRGAIRAADARGQPRTAVDVAEYHAAVLGGSEAFLLDVARQDPLVILVDDVQLADSESLALIAALARSSARSGIVLFAAAQSGRAFMNLGAQASLESSAKRWSLVPFGEPEISELVQVTFGGVPNSMRLAQWLHAQSAGNPATCIALLRLLVQREIVGYRLGTFILPHVITLSADDLADAMAARFTDFEGETLTVATALALHPGALKPEQLVRSTGVTPRAVQMSLDELTTRGVATKSGDAFSLPASSLRNALRTRDPESARTLHRALARALLEDGSSDINLRFSVCQHLIDGGSEREAAELMAGVPYEEMVFAEGAQWVSLLETTLGFYERSKRSREVRIKLRFPLANAGYFGDLATQLRHIAPALEEIANQSGVALARRLRRYLGKRLALVLGLTAAGVRRLFTPRRERMGSLQYLLNCFFGLVSNAVAATGTALDTNSALRFTSMLDPFDALPKGSAGYAMREFCVATAEVVAGRYVAAGRRYEALMPILATQTDDGLVEKARAQIYRGCLNGLAQVRLGSSHESVLTLADEIEKGDAFFAPHAEVMRVAYHALRGEIDRAETHMANVERLALRGGASWSAVVPMNIYLVYAAAHTGDAILLERARAELARFLPDMPSLGVLLKLADAWLEAVRGRQNVAIERLSALVETPEALSMVAWRVNYVLLAWLLNSAGRYEEAKALCERMIARAVGDDAIADQGLLIYAQLALAESGLGDYDAARARFADVLEQVARTKNPLSLGFVHHAAAQAALLARDRAAFELHTAAVERHYAETRNPSLLQQCAKLRASGTPSSQRSSRRLPELEDDMDETTKLEEFDAPAAKPAVVGPSMYETLRRIPADNDDEALADPSRHRSG